MYLRIKKYYCIHCNFEEEVDPSTIIKYEECPICSKPINVEVEEKCNGGQVLFTLKKAQDIERDDYVYLGSTNECHRILGVNPTTKKHKPAVKIGYEKFKGITHTIEELLFCETYDYDLDDEY